MSQVVNEIIRQVHQMGLIKPGDTLVRMDPSTLRVSRGVRGKKFCARNVDISYNAGSDLYDCAVHKVYSPLYAVEKGITAVCETTEHAGLFVEDLKGLLG